jgi:septal ring factor EnvC (AmiA/AmiB activator)
LKNIDTKTISGRISKEKFEELKNLNLDGTTSIKVAKAIDFLILIYSDNNEQYKELYELNLKRTRRDEIEKELKELKKDINFLEEKNNTVKNLDLTDTLKKIYYNDKCSDFLNKQLERLSNRRYAPEIFKDKNNLSFNQKRYLEILINSLKKFNNENNFDLDYDSFIEGMIQIKQENKD